MDRTELLRERILDRLVKAMAILGVIAYVPSMYASILTRMWALAAADTVSLAVFIGVAISKRVGNAVKLALLVGISLLIAGIVLFMTGASGAGYIWLVCSVFIPTLLARRTTMALAVSASAAIYVAYTILVATGHGPSGEPLLLTLIIGANLLLICSILGIASRALVEGLEGAAAEEKRLSERLASELEAERAADEALKAEIETKERLLKELHHRVNNNMQVVLSLLDIEEARGEAGSLSRATRRARAISFVNEFALSEPELDAVDLYRVVAACAAACGKHRGGESLFTIDRFSYRLQLDGATGAAIALSEIMAGIASLGAQARASLEGEGESRRLVFSWEETGPNEEELLIGGLEADPASVGLTDPGILQFEPASEKGRSRLRVDLGRI
jgi:Signal transduction histidine kinase